MVEVEVVVGEITVDVVEVVLVEEEVVLVVVLPGMPSVVSIDGSEKLPVAVPR